MKMMKVFDCQDMPDDVRSEFMGWACQGNDCYVTVSVEPEEYDDCSKVLNWLLVKHWW